MNIFYRIDLAAKEYKGTHYEKLRIPSPETSFQQICVINHCDVISDSFICSGI